MLMIVISYMKGCAVMFDKMNTYAGLFIDPLNLCDDDIDIIDIAHALSLLCRGGGHLKRFYSVGQHSINCALEAKARGYSDKVVFACLMHDASEAYISDIIRPVKKHLSNYMEIESSIMNAIYHKYSLDDLTVEEHQLWKLVDDEILDNELYHLLSVQCNDTTANLYHELDLNEYKPSIIEEKFMELFNELYSF